MRKRKRSKSTKQVTASTSPASPSSNYAYFRKHMRIGWWSLLVFLSLGLMLEALHGFKVQWYVGADNATRRLMLTLVRLSQSGSECDKVFQGFDEFVNARWNAGGG